MLTIVLLCLTFDVLNYLKNPLPWFPIFELLLSLFSLETRMLLSRLWSSLTPTLSAKRWTFSCELCFGTLKFRIWFLLNHQVFHQRIELDRTWRWQTAVTTLESWWHTSQDGRMDEQNAGTWSRRRTWSWWRTYSLTSLFILVVLRWIESGSRLDDEEIEDRTRDLPYSVTCQEETTECLRNQTQDDDFVSLSDWKMDEDWQLGHKKILKRQILEKNLMMKKLMP